MIRVALTFEPSKINASRKGQYGAWRVKSCYDVGGYGLGIRVDQFIPDSSLKVLRMNSSRRYRPGVLVDPLKILKEHQSQERSNVENNNHD